MTSAMTPPIPDLTPAKQLDRLIELEGMVKSGLMALVAIEQEGVYRAKGYDTFREYLAKEWNYAQKWQQLWDNTIVPAYKAIAAAIQPLPVSLPAGDQTPPLASQNDAAVTPILPQTAVKSFEIPQVVGTGVPMPRMSEQLRYMADLTPEEQVSAWKEAVAASGGKDPSGAMVKQIVKRIKAGKQAEADRRTVLASPYPYLHQWVESSNMSPSEAVLIVDALNGVRGAVVALAAQYHLSDASLIRELNRMSADSFSEIGATGRLVFEDERYIPLEKARVKDVREWLEERRKTHLQIHYDAATATYSCPMTVNRIDDESGVHAMVTLPKEVLTKLESGKRYAVQIRVVEMKKAVRS